MATPLKSLWGYLKAEFSKPRRQSLVQLKESIQASRSSRNFAGCANESAGGLQRTASNGNCTLMTSFGRCSFQILIKKRTFPYPHCDLNILYSDGTFVQRLTTSIVINTYVEIFFSKRLRGKISFRKKNPH